MELVSFDKLRGLDVVSTEAYILGNVADMRYNPDNWKIKGIRINQSGRFKKHFPEFKSKVLIAPSTKFTAGDVFLLNFDLPSLRPKMITDKDDIDMLSSLIGKKVVANDGFTVGTVDSTYLNMDKWTFVSISIKLDRDAHVPLGVKKVLFSKTVSGIQTSSIDKVGESVKLKLSLEGLKKQIIIEE